MSVNNIVCALLENWDAWVPKPSDIAWTKAHLDRMNHGSFWGTSEGTFRVDRENKTLTWIDGPPGEIFQKVRKCCEQLGWKVVQKPPDKPGEQAFAA